MRILCVRCLPRGRKKTEVETHHTARIRLRRTLTHFLRTCGVQNERAGDGGGMMVDVDFNSS